MTTNWITSLIAIGLLTAACGREGDRKLEIEPNPRWSEPQIIEGADGREIANLEPQALFQVAEADVGVAATRIVFWGDQPAAIDSAGYQFAANSDDHEILMFDPDLDFLGALTPQGADGQRLQRPQVVAAGPGACTRCRDPVQLRDRPPNLARRVSRRSW